MNPSNKTAQFLRKHNLDPESRQADRGDAIHLAIFDKSPSIILELLSLYPEDCLNAKDRKGVKKGRLPIHNAAELGLSAVVATLLEKGADPNARTVRLWTPIILASAIGQDETIDVLIKNGADINAQVRNGVTALHVAAELRSPDTLLKLLLYGADPKIVTSLGTSPLHVAVEARCPAAAALLLFHGASATLKNGKGVSSLDLVQALPERDRAKFDHVFQSPTDKTSYEALVPKYLDPTKPLDMTAALHWSIAQDLHLAVALLLHIDPYAVEARNPRGWHPLHLAARSGFNDCIKVLFEHGAEVNCITKTGWTPLMLAAENGHKETVRILLDHDANRTAVNDDRHTASQIANRAGHRLIAMLLTVRYVPQSNTGSDKGGAANKSTLSPPPKERPFCRTPSPGPNETREIEGA